jgi:hypothetical protein
MNIDNHIGGGVSVLCRKNFTDIFISYRSANGKRGDKDNRPVSGE